MLHLKFFCILFALLGLHGERNVEGSPVAATQFPFVASLRSAAAAQFCSSSIVSDRWVLTTAHCIAGRTPENTRVWVGIEDPSGHINHITVVLVLHPAYQPSILINDIGLIQTRDQIVFNDFAQPIALGTEEIPGGVSAVKVGAAFDGARWEFSSTITNSECLQTAGSGQPIFDSTVCSMRYEEDNFILTGSVLVVGNKVVGVFTWRIPRPWTPDINSRISTFHEWIQSVIQ
ncbi:trypsin-1-like [Lutzomyia longipalpis]|uniref:trypsin-1-like n=1 Tax=Lutzomyia longipalpis TaxID=7200 RepID=UPI0024844F2B|nr:trypsin-1-like [Lutzomyia longipalpis]